jgi:hypothetical protein
VTVTAEGAGRCVYTFQDANSQHVTLTVDVTTTTVIINGKKHDRTEPKPVPDPGPNPPRTPGATPLVTPRPKEAGS